MAESIITQVSRDDDDQHLIRANNRNTGNPVLTPFMQAVNFSRSYNRVKHYTSIFINNNDLCESRKQIKRSFKRLQFSKNLNFPSHSSILYIYSTPVVFY